MTTGTVPARGSKVLISADDLRTLTAGIFESRGGSRVPRYLELFDRGVSVPDATVTVQRPRAAVAIVDAHAALGPVAMNRGADEAVAGARDCGIGWASVRGTVYTGSIGYYTRRVAAAGKGAGGGVGGLAAVGVVPGMPNMAYAGARGAAVATSPLSVAVPAGRHELVLLDMATSVIALGRIAEFKAAGKQLPPGAALTADGEPTTDPALAALPLPVGGAKGSGMSLVFELLASALAANPIVPGYHAGSKEGRRHRQNGFILAVDVSAFLPLEEFTATVDATVDAIKALPPSADAAEVLVPGERGRRCEAARRRTGVPLGPKAWRELTSLAEALGVPVPAPLGG